MKKLEISKIFHRELGKYFTTASFVFCFSIHTFNINVVMTMRIENL